MPRADDGDDRVEDEEDSGMEQEFPPPSLRLQSRHQPAIDFQVKSLL